MPQTVIETVCFKLNKSASREDFTAAAREVSQWVKTRPGFVQRRLSCAEDGTWTDHIEWESMDAAREAAGAIGSAPETARFLAAIDGETVQLTHSELILRLD